MLLLFWMVCDNLIILLQNNCAIDEGIDLVLLFSLRILRLSRVAVRSLCVLQKQADP